MKSEWRVQRNYVVGETLFVVYRLRDIDKEDHSGNRENPEDNAVFHSRSEAEARAAELNKEEAERFWKHKE